MGLHDSALHGDGGGLGGPGNSRLSKVPGERQSQRGGRLQRNSVQCSQGRMYVKETQHQTRVKGSKTDFYSDQSSRAETRLQSELNSNWEKGD